jgi:hypothetical protein
MANSDIFLNLREKFREAACKGILTGDQKTIFELTMVQILNEAESQRQKCLKIQADHEREAANAAVQANSFAVIQDVILNVFTNVISKVQDSEEEGIKNPLEASASLKKIAKRQEKDKKSKKKPTKKTAFM